MALTAGVIAVPAAVEAGSSVEVATAAAAVYGTKGGPFCAADETIDRDTVNVDSEAGFVKALKAHKHQIDTMKANLPSGSVGNGAKKLVNIAESVIAGGNPNQFFAAASSSGAIDTYCGVQGNGQPLPGYYNKGTKTAFCKTFLPVFEAASNAPSDAATLAAVTAHRTDLDELASELSTLPTSIKSQATEAVDTAQSAIASKSTAPLTSESNSSAAEVALYCGQNE